MTIIKKKSMIVAVVSSIILSLVLILTLVGYIAYLGIKDAEMRASYESRISQIISRNALRGGIAR